MEKMRNETALKAKAEGKAEGIAEGAAKERLRALHNLMESTSMSVEQAMKALKISESEMQGFL
jgi:predicted transposase YdaD